MLTSTFSVPSSAFQYRKRSSGSATSVPAVTLQRSSPSWSSRQCSGVFSPSSVGSSNGLPNCAVRALRSRSRARGARRRARRPRRARARTPSSASTPRAAPRRAARRARARPSATSANVPGSGIGATKFTMFVASTRLPRRIRCRSRRVLTSTSLKPACRSASPRCRQPPAPVDRGDRVVRGHQRRAERGEVDRGTPRS